MQFRVWRQSSSLRSCLPLMMFSHERHCGTLGGLGGRADYSRVHPENSVLLDPELGDTTALIFWTARARPDGYTIDFGSRSAANRSCAAVSDAAARRPLLHVVMVLCGPLGTHNGYRARDA